MLKVNGVPFDAYVASLGARDRTPTPRSTRIRQGRSPVSQARARGFEPHVRGMDWHETHLYHEAAPSAWGAAIIEEEAYEAHLEATAGARL